MGYIHELAHKLARALRDSPENQAFQDARRRVRADPKAERQVIELRMKQWEVAALQAQGKTPDPEQQKTLQALASSARTNPVIRQYLEAEAQLSQIWTEVQRILAEELGFTAGVQGERPGQPG